MKVLNIELMDHGHDTASEASRGINPKLFLRIINYCLVNSKLQVYSFLDGIKKTIQFKLLPRNDATGFTTGFTSDKEHDIAFIEKPQIKPEDYSDCFYDEDWGFYFNEQDTQLKLRESSVSFEFPGTILTYLSIYNHLNRVNLFNQMLILETNKNLSVVTSNGLNGGILSSKLHLNPSYNTLTFTRNLYKTLIDSGLTPPNTETRLHGFISAAHSIDALDIGDQEKKLYNPLFENKQSEILTDVYLQSFKFADNFVSFKAICEGIIEEIKNVASLVKESKKQFGYGVREPSGEIALYELISFICMVSQNHLVSIGHVLTNLMHGLELLPSEEQERNDLFRKVAETIASFLTSLNENNTLTSEMSARVRLHYDRILLTNYYGLFVLSQFSDQTANLIYRQEFRFIIRFLKDLLRKDRSRTVICVQTYTLLVKIHPEILEESEVEVLADLLLDTNLDESAFKSICQFLVVCLGHNKLSQLAASPKVISALSSTKRFLSNPHFIQFVYYQGEVLDPEFSLWLWTLAVAIHSYEPLKKNNGLDSLLGLLKTYQARILSILSLEMVSLSADLGDNSHAYYDDRRSRNEAFRSTAYIQELELTVTFVSLLFAE